jgi:hypothetical protein
MYSMEDRAISLHNTKMSLLFCIKEVQPHEKIVCEKQVVLFLNSQDRLSSWNGHTLSILNVWIYKQFLADSKAEQDF